MTSPSNARPSRGSTPTSERRRWVVLAAVVLVVLGAAVWLTPVRTASGPATTSASATSPDGSDAPMAPDVMLMFMDGRIVSLRELRGRPLVLNFWASWCPACVAEMPDFQAVHAAVSPEVSIVGVNLQDDPAAAAELIARTGVGYPIAVDPDGSVFQAFGGIAMPTTVFIDAAGRIVGRHDGVLFADELSARIETLLSDG